MGYTDLLNHLAGSMGYTDLLNHLAGSMGYTDLLNHLAGSMGYTDLLNHLGRDAQKFLRSPCQTAIEFTTTGARVSCKCTNLNRKINGIRK